MYTRRLSRQCNYMHLIYRPSPRQSFLKGQCHKISDFKFFHESSFLRSLFIFQKFVKIFTNQGVNDTHKKEKRFNRKFFNIQFFESSLNYA